MKKLFVLLFAFLFVFGLSACQEDTAIQDSIDDLEVLVGDNKTDTDALSTALDSLKTSVTALQGESSDVDTLIDEILLDITDIETAIAGLETKTTTNETDIADLETKMTTNETDIAALDALIVSLQAQVTALENLVDEIINPEILPVKQTEIILAHTNDVHGRVNDDSWSGTMGMATIKNLLDALDEKYENTFFVDAGDILHGTTFATLEEGGSVLDVMNMMDYDLMVPGNHDFDYGQDRLLELTLDADFPIISGNIEVDATGEQLFDPYIIEDFDGVKVGFFGLTSPETVYKTHPLNVTGLTFLDPITQATAIVAELEPLVDVIVLVAHIGLDESTLVTTEDIALGVDGIDVIIDGHSHSQLESGLMVNDTLIVSTGEYNKNLGVLSITVQGGEIVSINPTLISADRALELGYGADEDIQEYIDDIEAAQAIILGEVVGSTTVELNGERGNVRTGETNLGNLIADSMISVTGADIAITNGGGIRDSIDVGDVTLGEIITVLPFGNIIVTKELTGQQIMDVLEYGTSSYPDSSGKFPHVAGISFEINVDNPEGSRVENVLVDGIVIDLTATYVVATNDFLAAGGDGYVTFGDIPTAGEFMGLHEALTTLFEVGVDIAMPTMGRIVATTENPVFFSQYGDGDGGSAKFVELYNPTDADIDLSYFKIIKGGNGKSFEDSTDIEELTGTLAPGAVLVIGNPACFDGTDSLSVDAGFPQTGIDYISSTVVGYINGDDALGLYYQGILIDTFGLSGEDPGAAWAVGNGNITDGTTANVGLIRIETVSSGETDWTVGATQWTVIDDREYSDVGIHTYTPAS